MWGTGTGNRMTIDGAVAFPHSLGLLYSAVTQYLGFLKFGDEYKVMGLVAYGHAEQKDVFRDMVRFDSRSNGNGFRLGLDYFNDNEPIVCRPEEAVDCFVRTQMDALVLGDFLISRA
jgi:predicted NodU family carbamoyl transferase